MKCAADVTAKHKSSTGNEEEKREVENKYIAASYMRDVNVLDVARTT